MAWFEPKTNWGPADGVRDSDLNRIEGNILELYNESKIRSTTTRHVNAAVGDDVNGDGTASKPYKTIMRAINSLPKVLSGYNASISIGSGTYDEAVIIDGFAGKLSLTGASNASVNVTSLTVRACTVLVTSINIKATSNGTAVEITNGGTLLYTSGSLSVHNTSTGTIGVNVGTMSQLYVGNTLTVTGIGGGTALQCTQGSVAHVGTLAGSNKASGFEATNGGRISYVLNSFNASGSAAASYTGGRIYAAAQTSIPNY